MPFIPYALAAASKLVGDNLLRIAFLKTVLLDLLLLFYLKRFLALLGADIFVTLVLAGVFAGPQFMLHSFAPMYEEGFLIRLLGVSAIIQLVFALGRQDVLPRWAGLPAYIAVTAAIYLLKSSMIFLVAWNIAFLIAFMPLWKRARIASVVLLCLPPLLWGAAVAHETGRFTLGTSIDGLNLLKGNNPATLDFYPPYTLDILLGEGKSTSAATQSRNSILPRSTHALLPVLGSTNGSSMMPIKRSRSHGWRIIPARNCSSPCENSRCSSSMSAIHRSVPQTASRRAPRSRSASLGW